MINRRGRFQTRPSSKDDNRDMETGGCQNLPYESWPTEKIESGIESTDAEIDRMVYELYNLTDEEIKIVEGGK